jgi:trehalose 6-phosphate synthase
VTIVSLALAFYQTQTERRGMRRELESHAAALASSMEKSAAPLVSRHSYSRLQKLVDGFQMHEHLLGVSIYDLEGRPIAMTSNLALLPSVIPNPVWRAVREFKSTGEFFRHQDRPLHVFAVPLRAEEPVIGALAVFYDAGYIETEYEAMWRQALTGILVQTVLIVCVTLLILRFSVRRPLARLADWLREVRSGEATDSPDLPEEEDFQPLKREVSRLATSLTAARAAAEEEARLRNSLESLWTPERLRVFVQNKLGNSRIFAISNREPYEHTRRNGKLEWSVPASGLVTALEPILRACEGTWIAQGTGDADRESVDENDRLSVPPGPSAIHAASCLGDSGGASGLLSRSGKRRFVAVVPYRAHPADFPGRGLGAVRESQSPLRRYRAGRDRRRKGPRRSGAGLSLCARAPND